MLRTSTVSLSLTLATMSCDAPPSSETLEQSFRNGGTSAGSTSSGGGTTYGGTTYGGTTHSGTTYGGTTHSGTTNSGTTYGGTTYGGWTSDGTMDGATSSYTTDSSSSATAGGGPWYAIPRGDIDSGVVSRVSEDPLCSSTIDEVESVCLDALTLEYPDNDDCSETLSKAQVNCQTWCQDQDHDDGACITEEDGPDHCECSMYRQDLGLANDEPGCVATYPVGDDTCEDTPREYALATCKRAGEDDVGEPDILVDKRTSEPGCAQSDIEEVEVNCDEWCLETSEPGYPRTGICRVVTADNCGSEEAAHCYCGNPEWASTKGPNLSGCKEEFEDPDACPDEGNPLREAATCDGDNIDEFPQRGCAPGTFTHVRDCDAWCKDEGHSGGTCQDASVDVTCPSGTVVQSAQCDCD